MDNNFFVYACHRKVYAVFFAMVTFDLELLQSDKNSGCYDNFFASDKHEKYNLWTCQKVTEALIYLLDNIYIRFGSKLYRQNVGI